MNTIDRRDTTAEKTFSILKRALFDLLHEVPFEKIAVADICKKAMIPRAAFYRYFEDKYHLLHCCLKEFLTDNSLDFDMFFLRDPERLGDFFFTLFCLLDKQKDSYRKIYDTNKKGVLIDDIQQYFSIILKDKLLLFQEIGFPLKVPADPFVNINSFFYIAISRYYLEMEEEIDSRQLAGYVTSIINNDFFSHM